MSDLVIKPATRQGVRPLIALYGESGSGKTYSSLLLARGFAGPSGKIVMIDTEGGRGSLFADVTEFGGYSTLDLTEQFTPARYVEAIAAVEQSGASIGICDSGSHEWDGSHGVLDMADDNEKRSGKAGLHNWRGPKMEHALFIQKLIRSTIPWVICLRAKFKTRQAKENGKTVIIKDEYVSPVQAEDFIFEATVHGAIDMNHNLHVTKYSHPDLLKCLPQDKPITLEHGRLLAQWCASGGTVKPTTATAPTTKSILKELYQLTQPIHKWTQGMSAKDWEFAKGLVDAWLIERAIITDTEELTGFDVSRLTEVLAKSKEILGGSKC